MNNLKMIQNAKEQVERLKQHWRGNRYARICNSTEINFCRALRELAFDKAKLRFY
jgi:hypothetical protein